MKKIIKINAVIYGVLLGLTIILIIANSIMGNNLLGTQFAQLIGFPLFIFFVIPLHFLLQQTMLYGVRKSADKFRDKADRALIIPAILTIASIALKLFVLIAMIVLQTFDHELINFAFLILPFVIVTMLIYSMYAFNRLFDYAEKKVKFSLAILFPLIGPGLFYLGKWISNKRTKDEIDV